MVLTHSKPAACLVWHQTALWHELQVFSIHCTVRSMIAPDSTSTWSMLKLGHNMKGLLFDSCSLVNYVHCALAKQEILTSLDLLLQAVIKCSMTDHHLYDSS